jgi:hypothetical protein
LALIVPPARLVKLIVLELIAAPLPVLLIVPLLVRLPL